MSKRDLLKLPDDLEGNVRALLHTPPPPAGIPGSRKAAPKPKPKAKQKQRRRVPRAATGTYEYEMAPVLKAGARAKKKAAKK